MSSRLVVQSLSRTVVRQLVQRNVVQSSSSASSRNSLLRFTSVANHTNTMAAATTSKAARTNVRFFSDKTEAEKTAEAQDDNNKVEEEKAEPEVGEEQVVDENATKIATLEKQVSDMKDQLLRSLAEQENTRRIAKRDVDSARNFAVSSFAKSLLDTSDNLSRALEAVPEEFRADKENHAVLATLYEGIQMTDEGLTKAFAKNGLVKFGEPGEGFDPNMHEALFEYPDPNGKGGTIGQVMKKGFSLNDRVIRPAEVGVIKKE
jgi:molecular chaperone GrpE